MSNDPRTPTTGDAQPSRNETQIASSGDAQDIVEFLERAGAFFCTKAHMEQAAAEIRRFREWKEEAERKLIEAGALAMAQDDEIRCLRAENERLRGALAAQPGWRPEVVERVAEAIYNAMRDGDEEGKRYPWVPGGNSLKQDEARRMAREALDALPTPPGAAETEE